MRFVRLGLIVVILMALGLTPAWCWGQGVTIYLVRDGGLTPVSRTVSAPTPESALSALLAGPTANEAAMGYGTNIPAGTALRSVSIQGGQLLMDFSSQLLANGAGDAEVEAFSQQIFATMGEFPGIDSYAISVEGRPLTDYLAPAQPITPCPQPPIQPAPPQGANPQELGGKEISLSPGHGYYNNGTSWVLQRTYYWGIVEDFVNDEIVAYLKTYLTNAGATVRMARETDKSVGNGPSGHPRWQEAAKYYLEWKGLPSSVWNDTGVTGDYNKDIRARPNAANYYGSDINFALHNNGGGGTGTETWYDTTNSQVTPSKTLATKIHARVISEIQGNYNSSWYNRGVKGAAGSYGEIRVCQMPSALTELAFHDMQSPDNNALHDEAFKSLASWAVYEGMCDYFGVAPRSKYLSAYVSDDIPTTMAAGNTYTVHITFKNVGFYTWTSANAYKLGAVGDSDPFAGTRQELSASDAIDPGESKTFTITMTAPATAGTYTTDWRLLREGVNWFGDTLTKTVTVGTLDTQAPSTPTNLTAALNGSQVKLNWTASTDNTAVTGYKVFRNGSQVGTASANSYTDTSAPPVTTCTYQVSAYDAAGNQSGLSNQASVNTPAGPVAVFTDGFSSLNEWTGDTVKLTLDSAQNHGIYTGGSGAKDVGANGAQFMYHAFSQAFTSGKFEAWYYDSGTNDTSRQGIHMRGYASGGSLAYSVFVGCYSASGYGQYHTGVFNGSGWTWTNNLKARSIGWHKFGIEMLPYTGSNDLNIYIDDALEVTLSRPSSSQSAGITRIYLGHNYAVNQDGWFDDVAFWSQAPNAPTSFAAQTLNPNSIRWSWADNSDNESGFSLQNESGTQIAVADANDTSYDETNLAPNTSYTRKLIAFNGTLNSWSTNTITKCTPSVAPSTTNVTCNRQASTWYDTPGFTFTAVGGFGAGKVQYYRYAFDQNPSHTWSGSEPVWNSGNLSCTASNRADNWYLHVKGYNSENVENGTLDLGPFCYGLSVAWSYQTGSAVESSPTVDTGVAYCGSNDGKLYALDIGDGSLLWITEIGAPIKSRVALYDGNLYFTATDGKAYSVGINDGYINWSRTIGGAQLICTPAVMGTSVYVGSDNGTLYRLSMSTGNVTATLPLGSAISASPAVPPIPAGGIVIVGTDDGTVYGVRAANASLDVLWSQSVGSSAKGSPAADWTNGSVYVGSDTGITRLTAGNGNISWTAPTTGAVGTGLWTDIGGSAVFGVTADAKVVAFSASNGNAVSGYPATVGTGAFMGAPVKIPGVSGGNYLYAGSSSGFYSLDTANPANSIGGFSGAFNSSPSVSGIGAQDMAIVGAMDGKIYAFRLR